MSKRRYRMYSDEFKRNALELAETSDKSDAQIERDPGMSSGLLSQWRKRYKVSEESNGLELSEVEQLKAELKRLKRVYFLLALTGKSAVDIVPLRGCADWVSSSQRFSNLWEVNDGYRKRAHL